MKVDKVDTFFAGLIYGFWGCIILTLCGCMSTEKTDALMTSTSMVVQEYNAVATEYGNVLDYYIEKNPESNELPKLRDELTNSQENVGKLAEQIEKMLTSTSLDLSQQKMIRDILYAVMTKEGE